MTRRSLGIFSLIFAALFLTSCSLGRRYEATPEVKATVVLRSIEYLQAILTGKSEQIAGMILWLDYIKGKSAPFSKEQFFGELQRFRSMYGSPEENPLVNVDLVHLDIGQQYSEASFRKIGQPDFPEVVVKMEWVENGWIIVGDSIFGKDGLVDRE